MGKPVKKYDLAMNLIKFSGHEPGKNIRIKITGLRPGEKLYEVLRNIVESGSREGNLNELVPSYKSTMNK